MTKKEDVIPVSAGLVIIHDNKILLGRPSCNKKKDTNYSIPKGHVEKDEPIITAAIRETYEEVGLSIKHDQITSGPYNYKYKNKRKNLFFYIVDVKDLSDIGMKTDIVDKVNLKPNSEGILEMEWAGFLTLEESRKRASYSMQRLIDMIEKYMDGNYFFNKKYDASKN